jgi:multicomponent Na+:H+ antiporter subunit D
VAVPLLTAAALLEARTPLKNKRQVRDLVAVAAAVAVAVMLLLLTLRTSAGSVYWFAGFRPAGGVAVGIDFEADPLNAGLACLGAVLMTVAMIFAWRYFPQVGTYFHVLMLTFLAGMTGFCLTGDVFDLFVWFELMGVSAYALTAYRPEERGPIQGAQLRDHQQRGRLPVADRHRGSINYFSGERGIHSAQTASKQPKTTPAGVLVCWPR